MKDISVLVKEGGGGGVGHHHLTHLTLGLLGCSESDCDVVEPRSECESIPSTHHYDREEGAPPPFVQSVTQGLEEGTLTLTPAHDCEGGTYFVKGPKGVHIAVFKPSDEEIGCPGNPKGHTEATEDQTKPGFKPGQCFRREVAAYLLDAGWAGVPETYIAHVGGKVGSLQRFVHSHGQSWDTTPAQFNVEDVHRIGVLDIRLLNADRHGGNILYVAGEGEEEGTRVLPIDHGFVLPEELHDTDFEWEWMPQSKVPFSQATLDYIEALSPESDAVKLKTLGFDTEELVRPPITLPAPPPQQSRGI